MIMAREGERMTEEWTIPIATEGLSNCKHFNNYPTKHGCQHPENPTDKCTYVDCPIKVGSYKPEQAVPSIDDAIKGIEERLASTRERRINNCDHPQARDILDAGIVHLEWVLEMLKKVRQ